jgi:hypothetical protein
LVRPTAPSRLPASQPHHGYAAPGRKTSLDKHAEPLDDIARRLRVEEAPDDLVDADQR